MGLLDFFKKKKKDEPVMVVKVKPSPAASNNTTSKQNAFLVVFSTDWCGPSKRFIKALQEANINCFSIINAEKATDLAEKYSIRAVPTTILLDDKGDIIKKFVGYDDEKGIQDITNYIKTAPYNIKPFKHSMASTPTAIPKANSTESKPQQTQNVQPQSNDVNIIGRYFNLSDLKVISMGTQLSMHPVDAGIIMDGDLDLLLPMVQLSNRIAKFLPQMNLTSKESATQFFTLLCQKTEWGLEFAYTIRANNMILGMVFVNTPFFNKKAIGLEKWTLDFMLFEPFEGKGIMYQAIARMIFFMKNTLNAKEVLCIVDADNTRCLNLMRKLPFDEIDNSKFNDPNSIKKPRVFSCPISEINFQRR